MGIDAKEGVTASAAAIRTTSAALRTIACAHDAF